jgi:predicted DNA binding CopG/RHH family protein
MRDDKVVIAGFRLPQSSLRQLKREAKKLGIDYGTLIRDRLGLPQPGDEAWPSSARKGTA